MLVVVAHALRELPWDRPPLQVLLDGVHLLLHQDRLPVKRGDEPADLADEIGEDEGADEQREGGVVALVLGRRRDVPVAHSRQRHQCPVDRDQVLIRDWAVHSEPVVVFRDPTDAVLGTEQGHPIPAAAEHVRHEDHLEHQLHQAEGAQVDVERLLRLGHVDVDLQQPQQADQPKHTEDTQAGEAGCVHFGCVRRERNYLRPVRGACAWLEG